VAVSRRGAVMGLVSATCGLAAPLRWASAGAEPAVRAGDDFYLHADGADVAAMVIPPDHWDYGQFDRVNERVTSRIEVLVKRAASNAAAVSTAERRVGSIYRSILDEASTERTGSDRLKRDLQRIMRADSLEKIGVIMAHPRASSLVAFSVFPAQGEWMVYLDQLNLSQPILELSAAGYSADDAHSVEVRRAYEACIAKLFRLAGLSDPSRRAADVVALDAQIAQRQWPLERLRDRRANLHILDLAELESFAPGLPWRAMLKARGVGDVRHVNLGTDTAVVSQADLFRRTPVDVWRSWLAFSWIRNGIDVLPASYRDTYWRFSGEVVRGARQRPTRHDDAIRFLNKWLRMDVARLYVDAHFGSEARNQAMDLLIYLKRAMAERLHSTAWLDPASRAEALTKLDAMTLKAGYPQLWPERADPLRSDDAAANLDAVLQEDWGEQRQRLVKAHPRQEIWYESPQSVDASYSVLLNSIELPAAILQPPFFSADAHPAENFGAIGALVGHEMGHGFDDQGMLYDSKGILRDWMSAEARSAFAAHAERLVAQYEAFEPLPGLKLNGRRTLGENIADLSGVSLALRAYELYRADHGDRLDIGRARRNFFLSWAKVWVYKAPESAIRYIAENGYHVPAPYRVNGVVRNLDAWYEAFDVKPGDRLYLAPDERVRLW